MHSDQMNSAKAATSRGAEDAVAAADRRLTARVASLRANWHGVKCSLRNALTSSAMVGGVVVIAGMIGARKATPPKATPPKAVECKCIKASPSLFRQIFLVAITPVLERAAIAAWQQFGSGERTNPTDDVPAGEIELPIEGGFSGP
jgi:hypothetical protein